MSISVPNLDNPKEHFLLHDSLCNISYDLDFSIFRKYMCKADCRICYIQNDWIEDQKFKKYIPIQQGAQKTYIDKLMEVFSHFDVIGAIDDMRFIKDKHPDLFRFYQEYGGLFHLSSMTDNAIVRQVDIVEKDIKVIGVREISISEEFLSQVNITKLLKTLDRIHRHSKILKIKVILSPDVCAGESSKALLKWCESSGINLEKQLAFEQNITEAPERLSSTFLSLNDARSNKEIDYSESTAYTEEFGEMYPIQSEILFLMYDQFYGELKSATLETRSAPFATLDDFEPVSFMAKILQNKITDYEYYTKAITNKDSPYYRYFKYVSENLVVHHDFNFLPVPLLHTYSRYYKRLIESGAMEKTPYGLFKPGSEKITPIIEFRKHEPNSL